MCLSWCCICIDETGKIKCTKNECRKIKCKRYFLPFIGIIAMAFFEEFREFYYFPFIISGAFFIIFWNFPILVYVTASKPLFYEDLFIDEKKLPNYDVDPKIKKKFQTILIWVLIITNSIFIGVLSDYWLYKTVNVKSYLEIIGVTGGIIKIFQVINNSIGRIMLKILKSCVKKENSRFKQDQRERINSIVSLKHIESLENIKTLELTDIDSKIISSNI
jgi:hypothetical protein